MFKRILRYFKKPSPIKDEINRRDQHLRGNVKPLYDHKRVRKLHDHIQALKFEHKTFKQYLMPQELHLLVIYRNGFLKNTEYT